MKFDFLVDKHNLLVMLLLTLPIVMCTCAKMLTPVGGPRDTTHPKITKMQPASPVLNFSGNSFKIFFDEYVVLNNPTENSIFSPPLAYAPKFTVKNKSLVVKINDTLRPNTTYNVVFTDCIKDFTEGNLLPFFQYTFSTGSRLDTFCYKGRLFEAREPAPVKNCFVFLYRNDVDSLPLTVRPDYITKTLADGSFQFYNIAEGNYKIFALKDINSNLIYDLPNEEIAFGDKVVSASPMPPVRSAGEVSTDKKSKKKQKNNSEIVADTVKSTDIQAETDTAASVPVDTLWLFTEKDTTLKLLGCNTPSAGICKIIYNNALPDFEIVPLASDSLPEFFQSVSATRDTVTLYFKEIRTDTMQVVLITPTQSDTLKIMPFKTKTTKNSRGRKEEAAPCLRITVQNNGELYKPFTLNFSYPIKPASNIEYQVVKRKKSGSDTTVLTLSVPDAFVTKIEIPFDKEEKVPYNISFRDSVFYGHNDLTNDSLNYSFTLSSAKDYGNLIMNYYFEKGNQYIIQLLKADNKIQQDIITQSQKIVYEYLTPGDYKIRVIEDRNRNGEWDTGNYNEKQQPEKIFYFNKKITIRGYWELEEDFKF